VLERNIKSNLHGKDISIHIFAIENAFGPYLLQLGSILSIDQIPATGSPAKLVLDLLFGCCDLKIALLGHCNILFDSFCARQQNALCFFEKTFAAAETPWSSERVCILLSGSGPEAKLWQRPRDLLAGQF